MTNFTKSDLRSGMKVQMRNGIEFIFMQNPVEKDREFIFIGGGYEPLSSYKDDLTVKERGAKDYDIAKVYSCEHMAWLFSDFPSVTWNLVWQRECDHTYTCTKCGEALPKVEPKEDKPKYKAGDKVRFISAEKHNTTPDFYPPVGTVGTIVSLNFDYTDFTIQWPARSTSDNDRWRVKGEWIEPYVEDKPQEPIARLYCFEDFHPGINVTKGKIYLLDSDGIFQMDGQKSACHYDSYESFKKVYQKTCAHLVQLVNRPAKVGEWVYVESPQYVPLDNGVPFYKKGDILHVIERERNDGPNQARYKNGYSENGTEYILNFAEYLVLDGYQSEPEKPNLRSKYEALTNDDLRRESCLLPNCKAQSGRKNDCPLCKYEPPCGIYLKDHPELRDTLIDYLVSENS